MSKISDKILQAEEEGKDLFREGSDEYDLSKLEKAVYGASNDDLSDWIKSRAYKFYDDNDGDTTRPDVIEAVAGELADRWTNVVKRGKVELSTKAMDMIAESAKQVVADVMRYYPLEEEWELDCKNKSIDLHDINEAKKGEY